MYIVAEKTATAVNIYYCMKIHTFFQGVEIDDLNFRAKTNVTNRILKKYIANQVIRWLSYSVYTSVHIYVE